MALDLNTLFDIAQMSPALDTVEAQLRADGHETAADALVKFQQDAGVDIDFEMGGGTEEAPGPESAALRSQHEPTSDERLQKLVAEIGRKLPNLAEALAFKSRFAKPDSTLAIAQNLNAPAP